MFEKFTERGRKVIIYAKEEAEKRQNDYLGTEHLLLAVLKEIERRFGRRAGGRRWSARVLDLDLVLWSGGAWSSPSLTVPHAAFRERDFVLAPARALVPDWRDPVTNLSLRQLKARLTRPRPMPR